MTASDAVTDRSTESCACSASARCAAHTRAQLHCLFFLNITVHQIYERTPSRDGLSKDEDPDLVSHLPRYLIDRIGSSGGRDGMRPGSRRSCAGAVLGGVVDRREVWFDSGLPAFWVATAVGVISLSFIGDLLVLSFGPPYSPSVVLLWFPTDSPFKIHLAYLGIIQPEESVVDWYISDHLRRVNGRVPPSADHSPNLIRMFAAGRSAKYMFENSSKFVPTLRVRRKLYKLLGPDESTQFDLIQHPEATKNGVRQVYKTSPDLSRVTGVAVECELWRVSCVTECIWEFRLTVYRYTGGDDREGSQPL
ncbi:hypothetical protein DFH09DRAFT_1108670 [Mycena vulgaris]|nr:hypothetical protein DFH09DRAFT_1108670 [Mycena vulgaris]